MKTRAPYFALISIALLFFPSIALSLNDEYIIGPKDLLEIGVFDENDLTRTVVVGPTGKIRFPLLKEVDLAGLSVRDAERKMEELLARDFLINPQVSISVKEYNSKKVYVLGAVQKPGAYSLTGRTTVLEIISMAGGTTREGGKDLVLVRGGANGPVDMEKLLQAEKERKPGEGLEDFTRQSPQKPIQIDGHKLLDLGDTSLNLVLEGDDILYVPVVRQVFVLGEVKRPGGIGYVDGLSLLKAITLAGGITEMGKSKVLVKRVVEGKEQKFKVNINSIIKDIGKDVPLLPDDVIYIQRRVF